ncbi:hypothetical protein ScPMuIL_012704 [Solemya velum]
MDPLGAREDTVRVESLTRWNFTTELLEDDHDERGNIDKTLRSPFTFRSDVNSKIILWSGNITSLDAHVIVRTTNEQMNDPSSETEELYQKAGPELYNYIRKHIKGKLPAMKRLSKHMHT